MTVHICLIITYLNKIFIVKISTICYNFCALEAIYICLRTRNMNKRLKWTIITIVILILLTIAGILTSKYISEKREQARLEAERIAMEKQAAEDEERYNTFIKENQAFFPASYLNEKDISGLTVSEVISSFEEAFQTENLNIHVEDANLDQALSFKALNINFDSFSKYVNDCFNKQTLTKEEFLGQAQKKEYSYDFIKDVDLENLAKDDLLAFFSDNVSKSTDAYVKVDSENGQVTIEPEVYGNEISYEILKERIAEAILNNTYDIVVSSEYYIQPQILSDDPELIDKKATLEKLVNKEMSIKLCGENTSLSQKELWSLYDGSDDLVADEALDSYISSLKSKYDSCYFNRPFTTSYGDEIILNRGNYGWVINADKTKEIFKKALTSTNMTPSFEVAYSRYGQRPALHEMTNTYIEVSILGQHVWAYVNGECLLSDDIISGEVTTNNPETTTNRGVFRLSYKQLNAILRGADYEEPVTYWMPFDGGIGFHDATWRDDSEFGGQTYMGNGSHGCVNMRLGSAETLFNIINDEIMIIVW